ncbi:Gag-Pol polyprotein [Gossypium australe]|uniref:Gag-Pol polyprotein n=1 Tax=Gossypium australe TaxID=47621 RepID=A0A5B6UTV4_9ROSI|nr:Gag-Pol polyprotein [Gossypium australe]
MNNKACFKCGLLKHFIRDCLELIEKDIFQNARPSNIVAKGRPPRHTGNVTSSKGATKDSTMRSEARAPARAHAIRAREDATRCYHRYICLYDTDVIALIDPRLTHSYVCKNLVSSKSLPVESTEFVIKVSNSLGKYVLVDKVCKKCPLMNWGYYFSTDLMLLPFDEFDEIFGMDWLTLHDAVVICRRKTNELKCQNNEILQIESDELSELPIVTLTMLAQKYVRKVCQQVKAEHQVPLGLLQPVDKINTFHFGTYKLFLYKLVELYISEIFRLHGVLIRGLHSDFGRKCKKLWVRGYTLVLHFIRKPTILKDMLRCCVLEFEGNRDKYLPLVEFAYNNSFQ